MIICVWTRQEAELESETIEALQQYAPGTEFVETPGDFGYWQALDERWNTGEDLIIIEHDIIIEQDTLASLGGCYGDWCTYAYYLAGKKDLMYWALGCTRFSAQLQASHEFPEPAHWNGLDEVIKNILWATYVPHCHGMVRHTRAEKELPSKDLVRSLFQS